MPTERHAFSVHGVAAPTIELDREADATYVRFSRRQVARTIDQQAAKMHIAVDLDADGRVVGIEAVGSTRFTFRAILEMARVKAPDVDWAEAKIVVASNA